MRQRSAPPTSPQKVEELGSMPECWPQPSVWSSPFPGVASAQAETETIHLEDIFTFPVTEPCHDQPGQMTHDQKGVIHIAQLPNGSFHLSATFIGWLSFVPDDPDGIAFEGHITAPLNENVNSKTATSTRLLNAVLYGSDGSMFKTNDIAHITVDANGNVRVDFHTDRPICLG
jgi:hypothetical protein